MKHKYMAEYEHKGMMVAMIISVSNKEGLKEILKEGVKITELVHRDSVNVDYKNLGGKNEK